MSKYTPGPWTDESIDGSQWGIYGPNGESIGMAHQIRPIPEDLKQVERTANARLMAAAPCLLDALRDVMDQARHPDYDWPMWLIHKVNASIDKATGE